MAWLLSPLAWLLLAGGILSWACARRRRWAMAISALLVVVAIGTMTPLGANALVRSLERPFGDADACDSDATSVAVVLGGGIDGRPHDNTDFSVLNLASRRRVDRAAVWWREREGRVLLLQGGPPAPGLPALAELMAAYAQHVGIPSTALRLEVRSHDTWSNAEGAADFSPAIPRRVVLVTSMIHMRRAREAFVDNGFQVCPIGTDVRRLPSRIPWALVPRTSAMANAEVALHEWSGLIYYRWRGRHRAAQ